MPLSSNSHQRLNIVSIIQKRFGSFFRISFSFNNFAEKLVIDILSGYAIPAGEAGFSMLAGRPYPASPGKFGGPLFVCFPINSAIFVGCLTFKFESECRK